MLKHLDTLLVQTTRHSARRNNDAAWRDRNTAAIQRRFAHDDTFLLTTR